MARGSSGESLLTRVMRILESFGPNMPTLTVAEIASRSDLPVTTTHRLVRQMVDLGMLERHATGRVRMGTRMWEMASRSSRVGLRHAAAPTMESLHSVIRQHVQLAVLVDDEVLCIERLSAKNATPNVAEIARRLPPYASSAGFVFLAFGTSEFRERVLAGPFVRFTPRSVTDSSRLRAIVASTRRLGYGLAAGVISYGTKGVSVPIRDADGVVAALSIAIPVEMDHLKYVPMLKAAAQTISRAMGAYGGVDSDTTRRYNPLPNELDSFPRAAHYIGQPSTSRTQGGRGI